MGISNRFLPPSYLVSAAVCLAFSAFFNVSSVADEIIMTSGKKGTGTIVSETATSVEIETTVSGRSVKRIVPKDRVYSIEQNGKRRVLNDSEAGRKAAEASDAAAVGGNGERVERSPREVFEIIERIGKTAP